MKSFNSSEDVSLKQSQRQSQCIQGTISRRRWLQLSSAAILTSLTLTGPRAQTIAASKPVSAKITWRNWSGINICQVQALETPADEAALSSLMRSAAQSNTSLRCVGAGHSFTALVPTDGKIISLDRMSGILEHDKNKLTVSVQAGTRLAQLSRQLDGFGMGLRNLPDIDAQSFAGAISTGTHGTGAELQALHADVQSLRIVVPSGDIVEYSAEKNMELLQAARVSLGSFGVITQAKINVVPAYNLRRKVWIKPVEELLASAHELAHQHRNFEFYYLPFTGYAAAITHDIYEGNDVQRPAAPDEDMLRDLRRLRDWLSRSPDLRRWVAKKLIDPNQTELATDKSWKLLSTSRPTKFNESECHMPRDAGIACVREVISKLEKRNEVFFPLEFRFVKADGAWLSPFYQRDTCSVAVHAAAGEPYDYLVNDIAPIFRKYQGRPHWGKLHAHTAADFAALYPRWKEFVQLRQEIDPQGRMLNPHLRSLFGVKA